MVYKKYIKRDGKIYGPYIYHSKRIDGKVVSEYHGLKEGSKEKLNRKHVFFILAAVSLALFFILFFTLKQGTISGNIVMNLDSQYQKDVLWNGASHLRRFSINILPSDSGQLFWSSPPRCRVRALVAALVGNSAGARRTRPVMGRRHESLNEGYGAE